MYTLGFKSLN